MNREPLQLDSTLLPQRVAQRLSALGVPVLQACTDGKPVPLGQIDAATALLLASPAFQVALRVHFEQLVRSDGGALEIWPGVQLLPLISGRRRRVLGRNLAMPAPIAVLLSDRLLGSDEFRLLCDQGQVDHQAMARQIRGQLLRRAEAERLVQVLQWIMQDAVEVDRRTSELHTMSQQLAESYEELSLLYKLSSNMTVNQPPALFLRDACQELQQVVGLRWMALHLSDEEPGLTELAGHLFSAGDVPRDQRLLRQVGRLLILNLPAGGQPLVVDDTARLDLPNLPLIAKQLLVVPLQREGKPYGVLFGGDKLDGAHISSVDSKLCSSLASSMSIFLQNMILFEDMQAMFLGTLHALTSSIDAKDSYTHGHSERVALMSRLLAQAAGLDEHTVERIYIAGLIHDVGKIGVPESVLCKPGRLTAEEFEIIKQHPEIGARILQDIKQMEDLIPGVLYHHERWDGNGYPFGLPGKEIPLFGRVIGLADSFDAMSTNRTYRSALQHENVMAEIRRCAGKQFDPELAEIFLQLDFKPFFELVEKHQVHERRPA